MESEVAKRDLVAAGEGAAREAWTRMNEALEDIKSRLDVERRVESDPYRTLAVAAGVGYVLGGGILSPMMRRLLGLGLRAGIVAAALPFLRDQIARMTGSGTASERGHRQHTPKHAGR